MTVANWHLASIDIGLCGPDDADQLARLHASIFEKGWAAIEFERILKGTGGFGLVAINAGTNGFVGMGLVRLVAGEGEIITLGVLPQARACGIATQLVTRTIAYAANKACRRLFLEVAEDNSAARGLYRKSGFRRIGRRKAYYHRDGGTRIDALVLACWPLAKVDGKGGGE